MVLGARSLDVWVKGHLNTGVWLWSCLGWIRQESMPAELNGSFSFSARYVPDSAYTSLRFRCTVQYSPRFGDSQLVARTIQCSEAGAFGVRD